jgi:crotonobetainyl-CoA:carnitine CoA-transferase CaiB-like acyl-CoA transferase
LAHDPRLAHNPGRVEHEAEIDAAIETFTSQHDYAHVFASLEQAEVPAGPIHSIADITRDPQYLARGMFERVTLPDGRPLRIPAVVPRLSATPGSTEWIGPSLGAHNREIYEELLGLSSAEFETLARTNVI